MEKNCCYFNCNNLKFLYGGGNIEAHAVASLPQGLNVNIPWIKSRRTVMKFFDIDNGDILPDLPD